MKPLHFRYLGTVQQESKIRPARSRHPGLAASILGIAVLLCGSALAADGPASNPLVPEAEEKLWLALERKDAALLEVAIQEGANVDCQDTNGAGPLLRVLRGASEPLSDAQRQCVALLLTKGANPNAADKDQKTLVIHGVRIGDIETLRLLVEAGAYVKARDRSHKTALLHAVQAHRRDIVLYLASNGDLQSLTYAAQKERRSKR